MSPLEHYRGRKAVRTDRSGSGLAWQLEAPEGGYLPGWRTWDDLGHGRPQGQAYEGTTGFLAYFFRTKAEAEAAGDAFEARLRDSSEFSGKGVDS